MTDERLTQVAAILAPSPEAFRPRGPYALLIKPLIDRIGAVALLSVFLPIFVVVGILIKLDSPGPVFYLQDRVGREGRIFRIFKFRTMKSDAGGPVLTQVGDPRITRLGRFLRRASIDELPQLFNILWGNMSFIGPRPEVPSIVAEEYTAEQRGVLTALPGLSGWAQIHGRDDLPIPNKLGYDLHYVRNLSLAMDLKIFLSTPGLLVSGRGIK